MIPKKRPASPTPADIFGSRSAMLHTVSVQLPALVANDIKKKEREREKQNAIDVLPTPVRQEITLVIVLVVSTSADSKIVMS